ncbi:MAG: nicotinate-nucleotide adenylyltransferase [Firmicutes bacterium]|jgi:nicotinate-nucleotide adenylyltransferase|nr:nicotinate-nucleotide adenylyltransferase [Bacillota bacterium]
MLSYGQPWCWGAGIVKSETEVRLGIMGGTFDPIHYGHLVAAEAARAAFELDNVLFVPNRLPPHKKDYPVSEPKHRYLMAVLATITNPYFDVSRIELDRDGISYTIDTLRALRQVYGSTAKLHFISGADAILDLLSWKDVDELLALCYFIAATRPGYQLSDQLLKLQKKYPNRVFRVEVPALAISSTGIRCRVREGKPIKYLLPEPVEYYIYKHGLYSLKK